MLSPQESVQLESRPPSLRAARMAGTSPDDIFFPLLPMDDPAVKLHTAGLLNQVLADTMTLRDLYKKSHWQASGNECSSMHLLYDRHHDVQRGLVDLIAERIHTLGGTAISMAPEVAERSRIPRAPIGSEPTDRQLTRLLDAHAIVLAEARVIANGAADDDDLGTSDIMVSEVIRTGELEMWFLSQHLR